MDRGVVHPADQRVLNHDRVRTAGVRRGANRRDDIPGALQRRPDANLICTALRRQALQPGMLLCTPALRMSTQRSAPDLEAGMWIRGAQIGCVAAGAWG
jgi:hypothetical protein